MRRRIHRGEWNVFRTALILGTLLMAGATNASAAGSSARAALDRVLEAAKQWNADAVLTTVSSSTVDGEGKSPTWLYGFHSPKTGKYLLVTAKGRTIDTLELSTGQTGAVPPDFLDSDQAVAEALRYGLKSDTIRMRLSRTEWLVNGGDQKGALTVWLHPRTGKLIKRQTVQ